MQGKWKVWEHSAVKMACRPSPGTTIPEQTPHVLCIYGAGSSRYGKQSFFNKVMLDSASDYHVSCFLYATAKVTVAEAVFLHSLSREAWDRESNWIGYIAVTSDELSSASGRREIYVVWRGTTRNYEWINVLGARPESANQLLRPEKKPVVNYSSSSDEDDDESVPRVMNGWLTIYVSSDPNSNFTKLSARTQLQKKIEQLRSFYKNETLTITLTGHSLGASLAILSAFDLVENGVTDIPVTAVVFGSPQVGNSAFKERLQQFPNLKILHIRNKIDLIPLYPSAILGYRNVGIELEIDSRKSTSLKDSKNPSDWHNLQAMLHVVAGATGQWQTASLVIPWMLSSAWNLRTGDDLRAKLNFVLLVDRDQIEKMMKMREGLKILIKYSAFFNFFFSFLLS